MKVLKFIFVTLVVLIVAYLIVSAFLPSTFSVKRSIVINTPPATVYGEVLYFKNYNKWSPWYEKDTAAVYTYEGEDGQVGSRILWTSTNEDVGVGSLTRDGFEENKFIGNKLFFADVEMTSDDVMTFEEVDGGTKVTWEVSGTLEFASRVMGLFFEKMMGPDFEKGLSNLKALCESKPKIPEFLIEETTIAPMYVITIREKTTPAEISGTLGKIYGEIMVELGKHQIAPVGQPFSIYHNYGEDSVDLEAGMPVNKPYKAAGRISSKELKGGNVVVGNYFGPYTNLKVAYSKLGEYILKNNKVPTGPPWESYETDPGVEPDSTKWLTKIYYPVE